MVMTSIMTTDADVTQKMGVGANTNFTDAMKTAAGLRAESMVNCLCRYNFSDAYGTLNADVKYLLSDIVSSMVAIEGISYDMGGYSSRTEAENIINILRDGLLRNLSLIRDKKVQAFIVDPTIGSV